MKITPKVRRIGLATALIVTLALTFLSFRESNDAISKKTTHSAKASSSKKPSTDKPMRETSIVSALKLDKLKRQPMTGEANDAFTSKSWQPPPPPPVVEQPGPPPVPTAPPLPFAYMGRLKEKSGKSTVYLTQGDRAYSVSAGDVIDGIYKVEDIQADSLTFTYLPLKTKQVLNIGSRQ